MILYGWEGKRAVKYKVSKLWNNLPTELKEIYNHSDRSNINLEVICCNLYYNIICLA